MSSTLAPFGLRPVSHPSGTIRQSELIGAVQSGYGTSLFTGTPVKYDTSGFLVATATGADSTVGSFAGCEFGNATGYFVLPYWPASSQYSTTAGPPRFYLNDDRNLTWEGQANGRVAATARREGINLADASQGNATTNGWSTQSLEAVTTGATPATWIVQDIAPIPGNEWSTGSNAEGAYPILRVAISTYQGQLA